MANPRETAGNAEEEEEENEEEYPSLRYRLHIARTSSNNIAYNRGSLDSTDLHTLPETTLDRDNMTRDLLHTRKN